MGQRLIDLYIFLETRTTFFPAISLVTINFETKLGSKSLEQMEDNERLKFTLVFARWYLKNRKSYRDEWKSVLKDKTLSLNF